MSESGVWPKSNGLCAACWKPTSEFVHQHCGEAMAQKPGTKKHDKGQCRRNQKRYAKGFIPPFCNT